jgi:hypothetical protein
MANKKYQVLSPDGFTIDFHKPYYTSQKKAIEAFEEWKKGYKKQGYYSSTPFGRIDLRDLHEYCTFKTI